MGAYRDEELAVYLTPGTAYGGHTWLPSPPQGRSTVTVIMGAPADNKLGTAPWRRIYPCHNKQEVFFADNGRLSPILPQGWIFVILFHTGQLAITPEQDVVFLGSPSVLRHSTRLTNPPFQPDHNTPSEQRDLLWRRHTRVPNTWMHIGNGINWLSIVSPLHEAQREEEALNQPTSPQPADAPLDVNFNDHEDVPTNEDEQEEDAAT
jgi:hypothetical protein